MINDFFLDECDIYHVVESEQAVGYGISQSAKTFSYNEKPDITKQAFHLGNIGEISTNEPQTKYTSRLKCGFPIDCDIRLNDKVVDLKTGLVYIAELPKPIRNHHIAIYLTRDDIRAAL